MLTLFPLSTEEIRRALKAMDLLKVLEGKEALGNKSNTKDIGEHKVRSLS
jgi:glycylpeptide N-tetradecanoyltransferase